MAQFLRGCRSEVCHIVRYYAAQRSQQNYYEILNISSDASQKEIKRAFIRLSKQLHPDVCGKHSHLDFVKLNEAYSILGKESTRQEYDSQLKYSSCIDPSYTHTMQNKQYGSQWEYEVRSAGGPWPPSPPNVNSNRPWFMLLLFFGFTYIIFMIHSLEVRKLVLLRNERLKHKYQTIRYAAHARYKSQSSIQDGDSLENLDEAKSSRNK